MAISHEWWDYHLTLDGWVDGSFRLDFGSSESRPIPEDRVLTIRETQTMSSAFSRVETTWSEQYRSDDEELVNDLLEKYGKRGIK